MTVVGERTVSIPPHRPVLGVRVDAVTYASAAETIIRWSRKRRGRYACFGNVHMIMEGWDDATYREVLDDADLVTADGMPIVWALRRLGLVEAERVYGPTLMLHVCERAAFAGVPVGFYGGRPEVLSRLIATLHGRYPTLDVTYAAAPPFRALTVEEDDATVADITASGARVLFVGLGCPKQERWMRAHRDRLSLVMLGVGAAFDFHAGAVRQAPPALQRLGLEWLFRLCMEPKRLAGRYARHNPRFLWHLGLQLWRDGRASAGRDRSDGGS